MVARSAQGTQATSAASSDRDYGVPSRVFPNQLNWLEMARTTILEYLDNFRRHAREVAYVHHRGYRMQRWTYGEVLSNAHRFARELDSREHRARATKSSSGARTAPSGWWRSSDACFAAPSLFPSTRLPLPILPSASPQQVDAKLCVCSSAEPDRGTFRRCTLETLRERIALRSEVPVTPPPLTRDDIVEIVFTSGTTAEPRGVVISHGNILANLEPLEREIGAYLRYERIFHPLRFLNLLPLEPRLRTVSRHLSAATAGRDRALPGHAEPDRGHARHQAGARLGGGRRAAPDGVAEGQAPARPGSGG